MRGVPAVPSNLKGTATIVPWPELLTNSLLRKNFRPLAPRRLGEPGIGGGGWSNGSSSLTWAGPPWAGARQIRGSDVVCLQAPIQVDKGGTYGIP
jgi:hypothetical protein